MLVKGGGLRGTEGLEERSWMRERRIRIMEVRILERVNTRLMTK